MIWQLLLAVWFSCFVSSKKLGSAGIVGGVETGPTEFPWLVNRKSMCGGALIHPEWFLTAGHCDIFVGETVDVNRHDVGRWEPQGIRPRIAEKVPHPDYNINDYVTDLHDIQLVRLATPVTGVKLARLVRVEEEAELERPGTSLTVAGWGSVVANSEIAPSVPRKRKVQLPVISNEKCGDRNHYGTYSPPWLPKKIYDSMMCAGENGKDACLGDSGAPLFKDVGGTGVIVGIVSWGVSCADEDWPGVFTRVSSYRNWINSVIGDWDRRNGKPASLPPSMPLYAQSFEAPTLLPVREVPSTNQSPLGIVGGSCLGLCGKEKVYYVDLKSVATKTCSCAMSCSSRGSCCFNYDTVCMRSTPAPATLSPSPSRFFSTDFFLSSFPDETNIPKTSASTSKSKSKPVGSKSNGKARKNGKGKSKGKAKKKMKGKSRLNSKPPTVARATSIKMNPMSCRGKCGGMNGNGFEVCYCDSTCMATFDCCSDVTEQCAYGKA